MKQNLVKMFIRLSLANLSIFLNQKSNTNKQNRFFLSFGLLYVEGLFINQFDEFDNKPTNKQKPPKNHISNYREVAMIFIIKSVLNVFYVVASYNSI